MNKKIEMYLFLISGIILLLAPVAWWIVSDNFNPRMIVIPFIGAGFISRFFKLRGETGPRVCSECNGAGVVPAVDGVLSADGDKIVVRDSGYTLCPTCRGACIVGIPQIKQLSVEQISKIVKGRDIIQIMKLFQGKSPEEINRLIDSIVST